MTVAVPFQHCLLSTLTTTMCITDIKLIFFIHWQEKLDTVTVPYRMILLNVALRIQLIQEKPATVMLPFQYSLQRFVCTVRCLCKYFKEDFL